MNRVFFGILLTTLLVSRAHAGEPEPLHIQRLLFFDVNVAVALPDIKTANQALTQVLGDALVKLPDLDVVGQDMRDSLLQQYQLKLADCASMECRFSMAKALPGIDLILETEVTSVEEGCSVAMHMRSLHTGLPISSNDERVPCDLFAVIAAIERSTRFNWQPRVAALDTASAPVTGPGGYRIELDPPGAGLTLNGKRVAVSSGVLMAKAVPAGNYVVEAASDNYIPKREVVIVQPGITTYRIIRLEPLPARLVVQTLPAGATVFLDNKEAGQTPLKLELAPGKYALATALAGYEPRRFNLVLKPNKAKDLVLKLPTWHSYTWNVLRYGGFAIGATGFVAAFVGSVGAPNARRSYDASRDTESATTNRNNVLLFNKAIVAGYSAMGLGSTMFLTTFFIE